MTIKDIFAETYFSLTSNKVRSGLTILGIVIGIGSVIAMISIGNGSKAAIQGNINSLGSNLLIVMPGMQRNFGAQARSARGSAQTLTNDDADAIAKVEGVKAVAPEVSGRYQVTAKGTNTNTSVYGIKPNYAQVRNVEAADGVFIGEQNVSSNGKVAVIGPSVRDDLFGTDATGVVGQEIKINKIVFKVIGVTKAKGGSGMSNSDDMIFIPITTAQKFLSGSDKLTNINIQASSQDVMTTINEEVTALLMGRHKIKNTASADFSIMSQQDIVATATSITDTFTILLGSVAAISLLVGGIGIMNMMLTTVTERTREIGLRKAIGAKRTDITTQFLVEAIVLTVIGGVVGVLFGYLVSLIVSYFLSVATSISLSSVLLAFGVSAVIGIVFGFYPARRAASLSPITALRYE